jgi:tetratricopeptide (TPR) repeat protein
MIARVGFLVSVLLVLAAAPAMGYPVDLDRQCLGGAIEKVSPERGILACTDILQSHELHPERVLPYVEARAAHYRDAGQFENALADLDGALKRKPADADLYNDRCWVRATWGRELLTALTDCDTSLQLRPGDPATLDSRALVYLRRADYPSAIKDSDAVLAGRPKYAPSLYTRGLAKRKSGDMAGGDADIAQAKAIDPKIAETYAKYGVTP